MNNYRGAADWSQATVENPGSDPSERWSAAANRDGTSHQLTLTGACPMQLAKTPGVPTPIPLEHKQGFGISPRDWRTQFW